jgi:hypothetical protein
MNLIEAVKSGKPFQRPDWPFPAKFHGDDLLTFCQDDILADDWEIEHPTRTITLKQLEEAWESQKLQLPRTVFVSFAHALGFEVGE